MFPVQQPMDSSLLVFLIWTVICESPHYLLLNDCVVQLVRIRLLGFVIWSRNLYFFNGCKPMPDHKAGQPWGAEHLCQTLLLSLIFRWNLFNELNLRLTVEFLYLNELLSWTRLLIIFAIGRFTSSAHLCWHRSNRLSKFDKVKLFWRVWAANRWSQFNCFVDWW